MTPEPKSLRHEDDWPDSRDALERHKEQMRSEITCSEYDTCRPDKFYDLLIRMGNTGAVELDILNVEAIVLYTFCQNSDYCPWKKKIITDRLALEAKEKELEQRALIHQQPIIDVTRPDEDGIGFPFA